MGCVGNEETQLIAESVTEEGQEFLSSLRRWLLQDTDPSVISIDATNRGRRPGEMSGTFDTVCAVASQISSLGGLAIAYLTWRSSIRTEAADLRVTLEVHGQRIQIDNLTDEQLRDVISRVCAREVE
ncbi:effector-associated constant component EACC1 [Streptomyces panaciradicis]|uniref:effector-associated constant component EACC1 n=1 Tax=Streptomyces panaciradicis TaxID=1470261 RepID=UPI003558FCB6